MRIGNSALASKGRATFDKKYGGKDLYICFPDGDGWYLYPHDEALAQVLGAGLLVGAEAWDANGVYHFPNVTARLKPFLEMYRLGV